jgi:succinate dehydrogenase / fumarate reductase cytochrome b subunit
LKDCERIVSLFIVHASVVSQMSEIQRPLSPHLSVYKWTVASSLSILHRLTGVVLSMGALALIAWVLAAAMGSEAYDQVFAILSGPFGLLILFGFALSFFYHLGNGIRHLFWDAGYGFDKDFARLSGWATLIAAVLVTALFWVAVTT